MGEKNNLWWDWGLDKEISGKPCIRQNNLKTSQGFPCLGLNPIIDSISPDKGYQSHTRFGDWWWQWKAEKESEQTELTNNTESCDIPLFTSNRQTSVDSGILRQDHEIIRGLPMNHTRFADRVTILVVHLPERTETGVPYYRIGPGIGAIAGRLVSWLCTLCTSAQEPSTPTLGYGAKVKRFCHSSFLFSSSLTTFA